MGKLHQYVADLHNITEAPARPQRKRQMPQCCNVGIVMETTGLKESTDSSQSMKMNLYFPILDAVIAEMQCRFDSKNLELMKGLQPDSPHFLDIDQLQPVVEIYQLNKESLAMECIIAKRMLKDKEIASINDILLEIVPMKAAFPVLISLLQISLTMALTTAECERSFSCLKRMKSYLCSSMSEQRLVNLAVLSIEKELSNNLCLDEVVDNFAAKDKNRRIQLH